ncbi:hypothetical protein GYMLUDRAFT_241029 [Collybiopsis luxurians FD-317 M1]|nr:hypothetical protein GYMLUDRAFT_241029 [Collybiopsis luxurians FD-317 M1]
MPSWQSSEKAYIIRMISGITITPVSYYPNDIVDDQSDKTFSALVFVQRRDVVLALSHLLSHHPVTTLEFQVGPFLGASDSSHRRAFLDISRRSVKQTQNEILSDFRLGERNLIVSTLVVEEGIDVQVYSGEGKEEDPVLGGNIHKAFRTTSPFSTNLVALEYTSNRLDIESDLYNLLLCRQLSQKVPGPPEYVRLNPEVEDGVVHFAYLFSRYEGGRGQFSGDEEWKLVRVPAEEFGEGFWHPNYFRMVYRRATFKVSDSVRWRWDPAGEEEEANILERYRRLGDLYPHHHPFRSIPVGVQESSTARDVGQYSVEAGRGHGVVDEISVVAGGRLDEEGEGSCGVEYEGWLFFVLAVKPDKMFLDRLLGKKWRLLYLSAIASVPTDESSELMSQVNLDIMQNLHEDSTVALTGVPIDDWIANETAGPIVREKKYSLELTTIRQVFLFLLCFPLSDCCTPVLAAIVKSLIGACSPQPGKAHLVHLLSLTIVRRSIDTSVVSRGPRPIWYWRKKFLGYEALDIVVTDFLYYARGKDDSPKSNG